MPCRSTNCGRQGHFFILLLSKIGLVAFVDISLSLYVLSHALESEVDTLVQKQFGDGEIRRHSALKFGDRVSFLRHRAHNRNYIVRREFKPLNCRSHGDIFKFHLRDNYRHSFIEFHILYCQIKLIRNKSQ